MNAPHCTNAEPNAKRPPCGPMDDLPWLLTPRQAAYLLDVTCAEIHRLVRRRLLRARPSSGSRWIETESLRGLYAARRLQRLLQEAA